MSNLFSAVTGLTGRYFGDASLSGYPTNAYYWVQAIFPDGRSAFAGPVLVAQPTGLDSNNVVQISWNPAPGSVGYDIVKTTTNVAPTGTATIGLGSGFTYPSFKDKGQTLYSYVVAAATTYLAQGNFSNVAHFLYDFAVDGGAISEIIPAVSDTIPINAVIKDAVVNVITAPNGTGGATVAIGTHAGSAVNAVMAATTIGANLAIGLVLTNTSTVPLAIAAVPVKMSAAGQISLTIAVHALTAGKIEGWVSYQVASA